MTTDPNLDPDFDPITPDDRHREVARLLARGLRRLLAGTGPANEKPLENRETRLEVRPETSVTGPVS